MRITLLVIAVILMQSCGNDDETDLALESLWIEQDLRLDELSQADFSRPGFTLVKLQASAWLPMATLVEQQRDEIFEILRLGRRQKSEGGIEWTVGTNEALQKRLVLARATLQEHGCPSGSVAETVASFYFSHVEPTTHANGIGAVFSGGAVGCVRIFPLTTASSGVGRRDPLLVLEYTVSELDEISLDVNWYPSLADEVAGRPAKEFRWDAAGQSRTSETRSAEGFVNGGLEQVTVQDLRLSVRETSLGRAARLTATSTEGAALRLEQCWSSTQTLVYSDGSPVFGAENLGVAQECVVEFPN